VSYCILPDCLNEARSGGDYCDAHRKRLQRGQPVAPPLRVARSAWTVLTDAALAYSDVDDEQGYGRAADRLRKAAESYARRRGK